MDLHYTEAMNLIESEKKWIDEDINRRTPSIDEFWKYDTLGDDNDDHIDKMWIAHIRAKNQANELYFFDNVIHKYFIQIDELESALNDEFPKIYECYKNSQENESYFISSFEINTKFKNIREAQLYEIIKDNLTSIFDYRGKKIEGFTEFEKRLSQGKYAGNPLQAIRECIFFIRSKITSVLVDAFPTLIGDIDLEDAKQNTTPQGGSPAELEPAHPASEQQPPSSHHAKQANFKPEADTVAATPPGLIPINVPPKLWSGKNAQYIYDAMKVGYNEVAIAVVLVQKANVKKTPAGKYFFPGGTTHDAKTYRNKINSLLKQADNYVFTFNEESPIT